MGIFYKNSILGMVYISFGGSLITKCCLRGDGWCHGDPSMGPSSSLSRSGCLCIGFFLLWGFNLALKMATNLWQDSLAWRTPGMMAMTATMCPLRSNALTCGGVTVHAISIAWVLRHHRTVMCIST